MKTTVKKSAAVFLVAVMFVLSLSMGAFAEGASTLNIGTKLDSYKNRIVTIEFKDTIDINYEDVNFYGSFDVSEAKDASITAWLVLNHPESLKAKEEAGETDVTEVTKRFDLFISNGSEDKIIAPKDSKNLFANYSKLQEIKNLQKLDMSNVTSMSNLFGGCFELKSVDLSNLDTSKVQDMSFMFNDCFALKTVNFTGFNTGAVKYMPYMFQNCQNLAVLDLSSFDTYNVVDMQYMFNNCNRLATIYIETTHINADGSYGGWNTVSVTSSENMFFNCGVLRGKENYDSDKVTVEYATTAYYLTIIPKPVNIEQKVSIEPGETVDLKRLIAYKDAQKIVTYASNNTSVVTVDNFGFATGVANGTTSILTTLTEEGSIIFVVTVDSKIQGPETEDDKGFEDEESPIISGVKGIFDKIKAWFDNIINKIITLFFGDGAITV